MSYLSSKFVQLDPRSTKRPSETLSSFLTIERIRIRAKVSARLKDQVFEAPSALCSSLPDELCAIRQFADEFALVHQFGGPDNKFRGSHRQLAFAAKAVADVLGHRVSGAVNGLMSIGEADAVLDGHPEGIDDQTGLRRRRRLATLRGGTAAHVQYQLYILPRLEGTEHLGVFWRGLIGSRRRAHARGQKQGQQDH